MELLLTFCVILCIVGFAIAILSMFESGEPIAIGLGIILGFIGLLGTLAIDEHIAENSWTCCGNEIHSEYCCECGKEKPIEYRDWTCCDHKHDNNIKFCPDCGKAKPVEDNITNNIVIKDNENVEVNVNDNSVVIIEDKWTCCDKELESKFCPDCGNAKLDNDAAAKSETIIKDNNR